MSDLLSGIENILFLSLWWIAGVLVLVSILTAFWLSYRRISRNKRESENKTIQRQFEKILQDWIAKPELDSELCLPNEITRNGTAVTATLLKYFKLVCGDDAIKLKFIIERLDLEKVVEAATRRGNRGKRLRAFHALSFLDSSSSLKTISEQLYTEDKYIRLSVARCLARRRVMSLISEVSEAVAHAFPGDQKLVVDVLFRYGKEAIPRIERLAEYSTNPTIVAGAVETLILMRPENSQMDFGKLVLHPDERVRAAVIELSTICSGPKHEDLLLRGLTDENRGVVIRSLKVAGREKRSEAFGQIYKLMDDPFMWIRYWAMRAAINSGLSGKALMRTIAKNDNDIGYFAQDVLAEG